MSTPKEKNTGEGDIDQSLLSYRQEPRWNNIPAELREKPQWVCWYAYPREQKDGTVKVTKPPLNPRNGRNAKVDDSTTWGTFDEAREYYLTHENVIRGRGKYPVGGVGFIVNHDYTGIDLDNCLEINGKEVSADDDIKEILERFTGTYAEVSPSRTGLRFFFRGIVPEIEDGKNRNGNFEAYSHSRFFTLTGKALQGYREIIENPDGLKWYHDTFLVKQETQEGEEKEQDKGKSSTSTSTTSPVLLPPKPVEVGTPPPSVSENVGYLDDDTILEKARNARNGVNFQRLWDGNWEGKYQSQSEADLALCTTLAFWTQDTGQIDRLFRQSGLYRAKWSQRHGKGTYGDMTIGRALESVTGRYDPRHGSQLHTSSVTILDNLEAPPRKQEIDLPLEGLHPVFQRYWSLYEGKTEAPKEYILTSLLVSGAAALGNKCFLKVGSGIRPNLYALLVGDSTFMRKTTGMDLGCEALYQLSEEKAKAYQEDLREYLEEKERYERLDREERENDPPPQKPPDRTNIYAAELSPEQLLHKMSEKPDGLFCYSEFASLLTQLSRGYMQGFREKLTEFYDGRSRTYRRETLNGGLVVVKNAAPSLLAASTFEWLRNNLKEHEMRSGFLARFLFVCRREASPLDVALPPFFQLPHEWLEFFRKLDKFEGAVMLHPKAEALYTEWYSKYKAWAKGQDPAVSAFLGRLMTAFHKVALFNHVADLLLGNPKEKHPEVIRRDSYEQARPWINFFSRNILSCYEEITQKPDMNEEKVREVIKKNGRLQDGLLVLSVSKVSQYSHLSKKELMDTVETMELRNTVKRIERGKYSYLAIKM